MFCAARIWPTPLDGDEEEDDAFSIQACAWSKCIGCALAPNVMVENMEKSSNLEARSADLATQAQAFARVSRSTRRAMWWQLCKSRLFFWGGLTLLLTVGVLIICAWTGVFDDHGDHKHKHSNNL